MTSFQPKIDLKKVDRYTKVKEQITVKLPSLARLNSGCASPLDIDHLHLTINTETSQFPASLQMTKKKFSQFLSAKKPRHSDWHNFQISLSILFHCIMTSIIYLTSIVQFLTSPLNTKLPWKLCRMLQCKQNGRAHKYAPQVVNRTPC